MHTRVCSETKLSFSMRSVAVTPVVIEERPPSPASVCGSSDMSDNDHSYESTGSSPRFSNSWEDHGQEDHVDHGRTLDGKQKKYINGALFRVNDNISGDPCFDVAEYSLPMDIYTAVFALRETNEGGRRWLEHSAHRKVLHNCVCTSGHE